MEFVINIFAYLIPGIQQNKWFSEIGQSSKSMNVLAIDFNGINWKIIHRNKWIFLVEKLMIFFP